MFCTPEYDEAGKDKPLNPTTMVVAKSGGRVVSLRFARIVFALFLPVTLCCANAASDFDNLTEIKTLQKGMPKDAAAFISKSAECSHWGETRNLTIRKELSSSEMPR